MENNAKRVATDLAAVARMYGATAEVKEQTTYTVIIDGQSYLFSDERQAWHGITAGRAIHEVIKNHRNEQ